MKIFMWLCHLKLQVMVYVHRWEQDLKWPQTWRVQGLYDQFNFCRSFDRQIDLETWGIASLDTKSLTAGEEADFCRISQSIQKAQCKLFPKGALVCTWSAS